MASQYIKSPLNYMGGKYRILETIMPIIHERKIETFYDVFAGGFNVGINANCERVLCNDQIVYLVELFQVFKNRPIDEIEKATLDCINEFDLSQTNAEGYSALRDRYNSAGDSIDLFVLTCFSFNHQIRFNGQHKFNTPFGRNRSSYNASIERNLRRFADALRSKEVEFSTKDFRELDYSILGKGDFAYFDPPYLISTGTYNDGKRGFCGWSIREERDLLSILDELNDKGVPFALSNVLYHKGMVNELLVEWADSYRVHYVGNSFANCSYHNKYRTSETVEVLITNY